MHRSIVFRWFVWAGVLLAISFLWACKQHIVFFTFVPVESYGWGRTDTLRLTTKKLDEGAYKLSCLVRHTERYPNQELWLVLETRLTPDQRHRDTLYLPVADEKGEWLSSGTVYRELEVKATEISIPEGGQKIDLLIYHLMPEQYVEGLYDVGVKIEE